MIYTFKANLIEEGNKFFISIPFNVWAECECKGVIPVKVTLEDACFECKLIPKGNGNYYIPVNKAIVVKLSKKQELKISFEMIQQLSRININSPYSKAKPIRKIDSIQSVIQPRSGLCGQACIAMLAGITINEVIEVMHSGAWQCSMSKLLETLDYYGISYKRQIVYTRGKPVELPECCLLNEKNHFLLYYKGKYYDSTLGEQDEYDMSKLVGYLEILLN